jgi:hypothetical protein
MRAFCRILTLSIVALLIHAAGVGAQTTDQKQLIGRWEGHREAEGRIDNIAFSFESTAKGIGGTAFYNGQEFGKITDITVKGKAVSFTQGDMSFTGVIDQTGKTIALTAHFGDRELWTLSVTRIDKSGIPGGRGGRSRGFPALAPLLPPH